MSAAIEIHRPDPGAEYFFAEGCFILETWNRHDDPEVSIARARLTPGTTTRLHRLVATTERYLILQGSGHIALDDGTDRYVGPGDLVHIPAAAPQRITNSGETDLVFLAICTPRFRPEAYQDIDPAPHD
ncbi:cupin domain-containing protein [Marichromatium bheemlicum]|uniref:Cupin domain-containing protein n=1 Tax=Marichromatium bheemlicum TaxID=365339 RepID=A0ABX1I8I3_9GAMM|nr:cupin domain-containing protein [Marichromatium bheemlicum]NKN32532.1 cupin domain-containing protein [Marichromatium bheemlicum]